MRRNPSWLAVIVAGCVLHSLTPSIVHAALVPIGKAAVVKLSVGREQVVRGEVAVSADGGRALAVWTVSTYDESAMMTTFTLKAASATIRDGSATWGVATALVDSSVRDIDAIAVDLSADGTKGVVAWSRDRDGMSTYVIEGRSAEISGIPAVQAWSPLVVVSDTVEDNQSPVVDVNASGSRALLAWRHITDGAWSVHAATVSGLGPAPAWGAPQPVFSEGVTDPSSDYIDDLTLGLSIDGASATLGWVRTWSGDDRRAQTVSGTVSSTSSRWGGVTTLASGGGITGFDLDVSADARRATAIWAEVVCGECVVSSSADVSGTTAIWGVAGQVSQTGDAALMPEVEVSADGTRAVALWMERGTGAFLTPDGSYLRPVSAVASIAARTATWGEAAFITEEGVPTLDSHLTISADGTRAIVSWMSYTPFGTTAVLKPFVTSFTISGKAISPVNERAIRRFSSTLTAANLRLAAAADSMTALALWIVDVDNTRGDPDIAQTGVMTFSVELDPTISTIAPVKGPVTGGTEVTINGSNFIDVEDVSFGFDSAEDFTVVSDTKITAIAPEGDRLSKVSITITTTSGEVTKRNAFEYTKGPAPKITSITPAVGGLTVEDEISIIGMHFHNAEFLIGGKEAEVVEFISATEVVIRVPKAARLGAADVKVTTLSGWAMRDAGFTYVVVPPKPVGVTVEVDRDHVVVAWKRVIGNQLSMLVTCTDTSDGTVLTVQVGKAATTATLAGPDSGTYACIVQGVGRAGAMGVPSQQRRLIVQ